jgi:signal transduction histidine kinase
MLHDLVRDVSALTELLALEKGIDYRLHSIDGVQLETDSGKVRQILVNLLSNAVKFTEEGRVDLLVSYDDEIVAFVVRDTGPGIRQDHLEKIFDPFWQAEQSRTRRAQGTGLGLAVARRLARLLGGDVYVDSTLGQGSSFTLRLPRRTLGNGHNGNYTGN